MTTYEDQIKKTLACALTILVFILCTGCENRDIIKGIDVSGYILEYGTLNPIEGARVYLVTGSSGGWSVNDTVITGPDGRYEFRQPKREPGALVALYVYADQYYDIIEETVLYPWKKQEIDVVMDPYAWLYLDIKILSFNPELRFRYYGGGGSFINEILGGGQVNQLNKIQGNRFQRIAWSATIGNDVMSFLDSIYVPAFDTVDYEIVY